MQKQFPYCVHLPCGVYDVEGVAIAEDGYLAQFSTPDDATWEPFRAQLPRNDKERIARMIQRAIEEKYRYEILETRQVRPDTAPIRLGRAGY